ncbi:hypothetical protein K469DRAFT_712967 [Zopfia rhizophila CBS 207.26]|uniref:Uncharacterized protein n=1 Tax=Zopfia rhizophila CBS 207.26 TaxID=1314779 RepID=A0A6A6DQR0_9PEZI|nr:hypothetical protein K469DRAFT_712967 [Zopfia rhizophila CBS 207.26]
MLSEEIMLVIVGRAKCSECSLKRSFLLSGTYLLGALTLTPFVPRPSSVLTKSQSPTYSDQAEKLDISQLPRHRCAA